MKIRTFINIDEYMDWAMESAKKQELSVTYLTSNEVWKLDVGEDCNSNNKVDLSKFNESLIVDVPEYHNTETKFRANNITGAAFFAFDGEEKQKLCDIINNTSLIMELRQPEENKNGNINIPNVSSIKFTSPSGKNMTLWVEKN